MIWSKRRVWRRRSKVCCHPHTLTHACNCSEFSVSGTIWSDSWRSSSRSTTAKSAPETNACMNAMNNCNMTEKRWPTGRQNTSRRRSSTIKSSPTKRSRRPANAKKSCCCSWWTAPPSSFRGPTGKFWANERARRRRERKGKNENKSRIKRDEIVLWKFFFNFLWAHVVARSSHLYLVSSVDCRCKWDLYGEY